VTQTLAIAIGGAAGALLRFWMSSTVHTVVDSDFPYGTLAVNVLGSLLMGLLYVLFLERMTVGPEVRAAILIGLLGAFTTFSTFSMETLNLLEQADYMKAGMNVLVSVVACMMAVWMGVVIGREL
jgi:CrcB protein